MKFCPLCFKLLLIEQAATGNRLICNMCRYYFPLNQQQKTIIRYSKASKLQVIQQNQQLHSLPTAMVLCPSCGANRAYYQQRQTRSADEASTLFYTCVQCQHKWNQS